MSCSFMRVAYTGGIVMIYMKRIEGKILFDFGGYLLDLYVLYIK